MKHFLLIVARLRVGLKMWKYLLSKTEGTPSGAKHTLILTKGIGNNGF